MHEELPVHHAGLLTHGQGLNGNGQSGIISQAGSFSGECHGMTQGL